MILDASTDSATEIVLQFLCVRLESWRFPIPTCSMFLTAFPSLSCSVLQFKQSIERIERSTLPHLNPHSEHTWLVGYHLLTVRKSRLSFSDLASHKFLNSLHPCKLITLDNRRFLTIPDTFKSSKTIV